MDGAPTDKGDSGMHKYAFYTAIILTFIKPLAFAKDIAIFDAKKNIPLSKNEPEYKDFYINAGTEMGLKSGVIVSVTRNVALYDAYQNKSPGDLTVVVGQLHIIHAQKGLSVGRQHLIESREKLPVLDHDFIMVGDRLDISTISKYKAKASNETLNEEKSSLGESAALSLVPASTQTASLKPESIKAQEGQAHFSSKVPNVEPPTMPTLQ
jgi:hypothetical protein